MKKSELKQLIKEQIKSILREQNIVKDYDFKTGEEVEVEHQTWSGPRTMIVTKPGRKPTLREKDGVVEIDLRYGTDKYDYIMPVSLIEKEKADLSSSKITARKIAAKERRLEREKTTITKRQFEREIKDLVSSYQADNSTGSYLDDNIDYEGSAFRDMAADLVSYDDKIKNYVKNQIRKWNGTAYPSDDECIEYVMNEMEQWA